MKSLNREEIETQLNRAKELDKKILINKMALRDKFKLNDIYWQSNWSLNNFNSYLIALKTLNIDKRIKFDDLNIILTDNYSGLQQDGFICLNCHQVIQQWLEVSASDLILLIN